MPSQPAPLRTSPSSSVRHVTHGVLTHSTSHGLVVYLPHEPTNNTPGSTPKPPSSSSLFHYYFISVPVLLRLNAVVWMWMYAILLLTSLNLLMFQNEVPIPTFLLTSNKKLKRYDRFCKDRKFLNKKMMTDAWEKMELSQREALMTAREVRELQAGLGPVRDYLLQLQGTTAQILAEVILML